MVYVQADRVIIVIQARTGSTRLPGKILRKFSNGVTLLEFLLRRMKQCERVADVMVAYPRTEENDPINRICALERVLSFRGEEDDVLDRFYRAALSRRAGIIARVCADNPLTDPRVIDRCIAAREELRVDYLAPQGLPLGTFAEILTFDALQRTWDDAKDPEDREHVTSFIRKTPAKFTQHYLKWEPAHWLHDKLTIDTEQDFMKLNSIISHFSGDGTQITLDHLKK